MEGTRNEKEKEERKERGKETGSEAVERNFAKLFGIWLIMEVSIAVAFALKMRTVHLKAAIRRY